MPSHRGFFRITSSWVSTLGFSDSGAGAGPMVCCSGHHRPDGEPKWLNVQDCGKWVVKQPFLSDTYLQLNELY